MQQSNQKKLGLWDSEERIKHVNVHITLFTIISRWKWCFCVIIIFQIWYRWWFDRKNAQKDSSVRWSIFGHWAPCCTDAEAGYSEEDETVSWSDDQRAGKCDRLTFSPSCIVVFIAYMHTYIIILKSNKRHRYVLSEWCRYALKNWRIFDMIMYRCIIVKDQQQWWCQMLYKWHKSTYLKILIHESYKYLLQLSTSMDVYQA